MKVEVKMPSTDILSALGKIPAQTRTALSKAMNTTVKQAETAVVAEMRSVFDKPTPWALGGITSDAATTGSLQATVRVRGRSGTAIPADSFLAAEIEGGPRRFKRFEVALFKKGVMPAGYFAVPSGGATIDAFGNMSAGQITQILAWFEAFPPSGYRSNSTAATRAKRQKGTRKTRGSEYVAIGLGVKGLVPGVWQRTDFGALGKGMRLVLAFVRRTTYSKRLRFYETVEQTFDKQLPVQYGVELQSALGRGGDL